MSNKFLQHDSAGGFREVQAVNTGGAPQANKIPSLDASGRLDPTMMPTGVGAETSIVPAFGNLAAGDLVNVFNDGKSPFIKLCRWCEFHSFVKFVDGLCIGFDAHFVNVSCFHLSPQSLVQ
jgi:hypothetical protein